MTGKLLKYDLKSMLRNFIPLWAALVAVSIINCFTIHSLDHGVGAEQLPAMVAMLVYGSLVVAVMVVTAVLVIQRFYQGLLKDEGYLMFTLPVQPWQLLTSKLAAAVIVCLGSCIVGGISVMVIAFDSETYLTMFDAIGLAFRLYPGPIVAGCLAAIASGLCSITQIYVSLALGHLTNKHRIGWAVGIYIAIHMVFSWLELAVSITIPVPLFQDATQYFLLLAGYYFLRAVLFFVVTERILSKKLNLE